MAVKKKTLQNFAAELAQSRKGRRLKEENKENKENKETRQKTVLRKVELNDIPDGRKGIRHPPFMGRKMLTPSSGSLSMISSRGNEGR